MAGRKIKLLNALPIAAIQTPVATIRIRQISHEEARQLVQGVEIESYVGHQSTATALTTLLGREVKMNRAEAQLHIGDTLLIAVLTRRVAGDQEVKPEELRLYVAEILA